MYFQYAGPRPSPPAKTGNYKPYGIIHRNKMPADLQRLKARLLRITHALSKCFEQLPNALFVCEISKERRNAPAIRIDGVGCSRPVPNRLKQPRAFIDIHATHTRSRWQALRVGGFPARVISRAAIFCFS